MGPEDKALDLLGRDKEGDQMTKSTRTVTVRTVTCDRCGAWADCVRDDEGWTNLPVPATPEPCKGTDLCVTCSGDFVEFAANSPAFAEFMTALGKAAK